jgi:hypothetical protein
MASASPRDVPYLTYSISGELFGHDYRQQLPYHQLNFYHTVQDSNIFSYVFLLRLEIYTESYTTMLKSYSFGEKC